MRLCMLVVLTIGLTLTVIAQQGQTPKTMDSPSQKDAFERVHENLFGTQPDKAAEASRLTKAVSGSLPASSAAFDKVARKNLVDEQIFSRIERDRIPHAPVAGNEEFLRRAYLDATGLLPTPEAVRDFVASKDPLKRDKLIDSLIGSDEFTEQWAWFFGDLFQNFDDSAYWWTKRWLKLDRPYNQTFEEIVTGTAKSHVMIPALWMNYPAMYLGSRNIPNDPDDYRITNRLDFIDVTTVNLSRIFLGINFDCISCHDGAGHLESLNLYLAERKRKEFHQQAAFFGNYRLLSSVNRGFAVDATVSILDDEGGGYNTGHDAPYFTAAEGKFPRSGQTYEPSFILTGEKPKPGENPRKALARIVPTHIQFSRAIVNLIWSRLMVVGFVDPYDGFDMARLDPKNPPPKPWTIQPTNPELLDALANDFRSNNFSLHRLMKTIMKSNAYQLSTQFPGEWKDDYIPYYARRFVRVMRGSEVVDAISQVTGRPFQFKTATAASADDHVNSVGEKITRIKQLTEPSDARGIPKEGNAVFGLMAAFFQLARDASAAAVNPAAANNVTPVQAIMMMESSIVTDRVLANGGSRVQRLLESGKSDSDLVEELFLAALSRRPMPNEKQVALQMMERDRRVGAETIQWALLNNSEFLLNH